MSELKNSYEDKPYESIDDWIQEIKHLLVPTIILLILILLILILV